MPFKILNGMILCTLSDSRNSLKWGDFILFFFNRKGNSIQPTQIETMKLETLAQLVHEIGLHQSTFEGDLEVVINAFQQVDKHT